MAGMRMILMRMVRIIPSIVKMTVQIEFTRHQSKEEKKQEKG